MSFAVPPSLALHTASARFKNPLTLEIRPGLPGSSRARFNSFAGCRIFQPVNPALFLPEFYLLIPCQCC
ncbi:hypothetical protein KIS1582_4894 [Cytobacillus firmus]|uniref:Uncharacterized protein n=1 Tax=Cytobacillus firmus TaxID=1399 RepID=A0A800MS49_CYTFI|nr:hypothetical protein KIS1582_4894 [Cytobacillus firmus]